MTSLPGSPSESEIWIIGTAAESAASARKRVAKGLLLLLKDRDYDSQNLEEILLVIDHECLCLELNSTDVHGWNDIFESTIEVPAVADFADQLSSCLVLFDHVSSHFDRAVQCRALLSVLALLKTHKARVQQADSHTKWQKQINGRFRDQVWRPGESTEFSAEVFSATQCSHLITLVAAYNAQHFVRAESTASILLDLGNNMMRIGVTAVSKAFAAQISRETDDLETFEDE